MLTTKTIRLWCKVHKWSSLVCTAFLLLLCLTGLPLIFHEEIDRALGHAVVPPPMPAGTPKTSLDRVVDAGQGRHPGEIVRFLVWDADEPNLVYLTMAKPSAAPDDNRVVFLDERTADVLGEPNLQEGVMYVLLKLHIDLFAGLGGKLFLGLMGLLFIVAVVSGVVVYGPFMRRLDFGTVRKEKSARVRWLDLHNLLGVVTLAWALVVGATGVINTWADLVLRYWQYDQLSSMIAPYKGRPAPTELGSLQLAVDTARVAAPGMTPSFVAFPGSVFSSEHHFAVFMRGDTPLTSRLVKPVLVDAVTGELTDTRDLPWYVSALLVSQPLHFGDYGGMPLKIVWALFDVVTIVVLGSGLYLWVSRRKSSIEIRIEELERERVAAAV